MKWEDTVMSLDRINIMIHDEANTCLGIDLVVHDIAKAQAEVSFKAGVRAVVDYFFYDAGIVRLMGCRTMAQAKAGLPKWDEKLKEWGIQDSP